MIVEARIGGHALGEKGETAGDQKRCGAVRLHGGDEGFGARRQPHAFGVDAAEAVDGEPLQQGHTFAQRRLERDFATHRAFGDGGDLRLQAHHVRDFVQAFDRDDGRIHVRDQKLFAPVGGGNDVHIPVVGRRDGARGGKRFGRIAIERPVEGTLRRQRDEGAAFGRQGGGKRIRHRIGANDVENKGEFLCHAWLFAIEGR